MTFLREHLVWVGIGLSLAAVAFLILSGWLWFRRGDDSSDDAPAGTAERPPFMTVAQWVCFERFVRLFAPRHVFCRVAVEALLHVAERDGKPGRKAPTTLGSIDFVICEDRGKVLAAIDVVGASAATNEAAADEMRTKFRLAGIQWYRWSMQTIPDDAELKRLVLDATAAAEVEVIVEDEKVLPITF